MPAPTRTYAVGSFNRVVRQDDHSGTWIDISPNVSLDTTWHDVMTSPTNPDHVFIVGDVKPGGGGYLPSGILFSTDAGVTWQVPVGDWDDTTYGLTTYYEIWVLDSVNAWVVGDNGWVIKTQSGGTAFVHVNPGSAAAFPGGGDWEGTRCIHALDASTAVVAGSDNGSIGALNARVWKTINGGQTWTALNTGPNYYSQPVAPNLRNAYGWAIDTVTPGSLILISGGTGYSNGTDVATVTSNQGKDLLLDITTAAGVVTGFSFGSNGGGRDFDTGEIVTVQGGNNDATFQVVNAIFANPPGTPEGVWMSADQQNLVVTTGYTQQVSIDGGQNFITAGPNFQRAAQHLTWYPSHEWQNGLPTRMRHVGGIGFGLELTESLDLGSNWTIERQNTGVHMVGAHFYSPQNGYYTHTNELYRTSNGGVTGILTYSDSAAPVPTWEAVWTETPTIIYRLVDCSGQANDQFVTDPNMANYVGQVIQIDPPDADLPIDLCWTVEEYDQFALTYDQPVPVLGEFATCEECDPSYYELTDCEGNEAPIYTTTPLGQYAPVAGAKVGIAAIVLTPCCGGDVLQSALISQPPPAWLSDINALPAIIKLADTLGNEYCYAVSTTIIPFTVTQPPGFIENPLDAEVTILAAVDCAEAALEDPECDCGGNPAPLVYPGNVIQIEGCPNVCWTVTQIPPDTTLELTDVTVTTSYQDCEDCLPSEPEEPLIIRNRTVKPGYNVPGICSPEYHDKIVCRFAEAVYQQMASKRFGIVFCCEAEEDLDKYDIKKEMLNLALITDPNACAPTTTPSEECCPPCNVVAMLEIYGGIPCPAPENVDAVLVGPPLPPPPLCPEPENVAAQLDVPPTPPIPCPPPENVEATLETPALACHTYEITIFSDSPASTLSYTDCDGNPVVLDLAAATFTYTFEVCAQDTPVSSIGATIVQVGNCDGGLAACVQVEYSITWPSALFGGPYTIYTCGPDFVGFAPSSGGTFQFCGRADQIPFAPTATDIIVTGQPCP